MCEPAKVLDGLMHIERHPGWSTDAAMMRQGKASGKYGVCRAKRNQGKFTRREFLGRSAGSFAASSLLLAKYMVVEER